LHAATLVRLRPSANHEHSPLQLVSGKEPNISHLKIFGCAVFIPIGPPQRTKMGPQRRLGIYVGFESPSIIKYLEPTTCDLFKERFDDCHFDENMFPTLGGEQKDTNPHVKEITWNATALSFLDPRTKLCEQEVQRIIHLQNITNQLPDAFTDTKKVTKSYIPAANAPARIEMPTRLPNASIAHESTIRRKRGRPLGLKDLKPRKERNQNGKIVEAATDHANNDKGKDIENENTSQECDAMNE